MCFLNEDFRSRKDIFWKFECVKLKGGNKGKGVLRVL